MTNDGVNQKPNIVLFASVTSLLLLLLLVGIFFFHRADKTGTYAAKAHETYDVSGISASNIPDDLSAMVLNSMDPWESGDFDEYTGEKIDHRRRLRLKEYIVARHEKYIVKLSEGFTFSVFEYDPSGVFLKSDDYINGEIIALSPQTATFCVSIRRDEDEKKLSPGQWGRFIRELDIMLLY